MQVNGSHVGSISNNKSVYNVGDSALTELFLSMMGPFAVKIGRYAAEQLDQILTPDDKMNVSSHILSVKRLTKVQEPKDSARWNAEFGDWAFQSSGANDNAEPEFAAAWRAALEGIYKDNDYALIGIVKNLNKEDITLLLSVTDVEFFEYSSGIKFLNYGIVRRAVLRSAGLRKYVHMAFALLVMTAVGFVSSELYPYFNANKDGDVGRFIQIGKWFSLFAFIIFFLAALYINSDRLISYYLTPYGEKLAIKVRKYWNDIVSARPSG